MRLKLVGKWKKEGGVLITTYDLFRNLVTFNNQFYEYLINPGPDIIVLDEGHKIKDMDVSGDAVCE